MTVPVEPPDFTGYVPATIWGLTEQDVVEQILATAALDWPGWTPNELHTEMMVVKAGAVLTALLGSALDRIPAVAMEGWALLVGVARDPGLRPTATVTFASSDPVTVPAGAELRLDLAGGLQSLTFLTDVDIAVPGGGTATVDATGQTETADANGTLAGTALTVVSGASVDTAVLGSTVTGGREPEDDLTYLSRVRARLSRLTEVLVTPAHYLAAAQEDPAVSRALVANLYDPTVGSGAPGDHPGHVTVAVAGPGATSLSGAQKTAIEETLNDPDRIVAGVVAHVTDATVTAVDVTATVRRLAGFDPTVVKEACEAAVKAYLDPDTWRADTVVRRFEIVGRLDAVEGVDVVLSLTTPAADVVLAGALPLVKPGTVTVTVDAP